ncbi:hypothetical protein EZV61_19295 [Corallincola luteus]|uniref:Uncharacterized protein n=1 Tax=Corallincola luteus TaxID=1775177 RepID=A0ABY2AHQ5_9GAMM|nr:hypothetical protein [Corallincola luteus]TCI01084.1 hypothetical protein EZV61_19295 [Corallincola luteus]
MKIITVFILLLISSLCFGSNLPSLESGVKLDSRNYFRQIIRNDEPNFLVAYDVDRCNEIGRLDNFKVVSPKQVNILSVDTMGENSYRFCSLKEFNEFISNEFSSITSDFLKDNRYKIENSFSRNYHFYINDNLCSNESKGMCFLSIEEQDEIINSIKNENSSPIDILNDEIFYDKVNIRLYIDLLKGMNSGAEKERLKFILFYWIFSDPDLIRSKAFNEFLNFKVNGKTLLDDNYLYHLYFYSFSKGGASKEIAKIVADTFYRILDSGDFKEYLDQILFMNKILFSHLVDDVYLLDEEGSKMIVNIIYKQFFLGFHSNINVSKKVFFSAENVDVINLLKFVVEYYKSKGYHCESTLISECSLAILSQLLLEPFSKEYKSEEDYLKDTFYFELISLSLYHSAEAKSLVMKKINSPHINDIDFLFCIFMILNFPNFEISDFDYSKKCEKIIGFRDYEYNYKTEKDYIDYPMISAITIYPKYVDILSSCNKEGE